MLRVGFIFNVSYFLIFYIERTGGWCHKFPHLVKNISLLNSGKEVPVHRKIKSTSEKDAYCENYS